MELLTLKSPDEWTLADGLIASGEQIILDRVEDYFNDGSLDSANLGTVTEAGGTVVESLGVRLFTSLASCAILYPKAGIDKTKSGFYRTVIRGSDAALYFSAFLQQASTKPVTGAAAAVANNRIMDLIDIGTDVFLYRWTAAGGTKYWNEALEVWQVASVTLPSIGSNNKAMEILFRWTPTQWKLTLKNKETGVDYIDTSWVDWSDTKNNGVDPYWFGVGDYLTNFWSSAIAVMLMENQYTNGAAATMGEVEFYGTTILQNPITETTEGGASVSYRYNLNRGGWSASKTLSELSDELVGAVCYYLDIEATFTTDGEAAASIDINGGVMAAPGRQGGSRFMGPLGRKGVFN